MDDGPRLVAAGAERERMTSDRYQQVKQVFLAACDLDPPQVAPFLDQACAADPDLRREVESLLEHHYAATVAHHAPTADPRQTVCRERFPPGKILAGRYRILGPLGRGGMGDVYRADDLMLAQPVALKFLASRRSETPAWLDRYRTEVRLARRVTHVNVLRVYDIVEADGEVFISMEYVDGEDLASLLRRVGRLTGEKVVQIARQLCAGLAAAHDRGVLHRDLKPANIMIDGQGQVRIADFGIASLASQVEASGSLVGTPAYMAPELFDGRSPSVRSDLYALGIVLYEALVGKPPFDGRSLGRREPRETLVPPSAIVPDVDLGLDRIVCQCLAQDPQRRPDSAHAVAMALPGASPLAEAMARGETPSPSMIAAAEAKWSLPASAAVAALAAAAVALLVVLLLADKTFLLPQVGLAKPPQVLADRAEQIVAALAGATDARQRDMGFAVDRGFLESELPGQQRRQVPPDLGDLRPPAVYFWYRIGRPPITVPTLLNEPVPTRSLAPSPDAISLHLDGQGRLVRYLAAAEPGAGDSPPAAVDWGPVFELAGLRLADFRPARPAQFPPAYADALAAWEETSPETPGLRMHVEAGSAGGRVVYFNIVPPWERHLSKDLADEAPTRLHWGLPVVRWLVYVLGMLGGGLLAWRNIEAGRGDLRGASKLAAFVLLVGLLDWLFGDTHSASLLGEAASLYLWVARATLTAAVAWVCYIAVEPYVRRYWPDIMITWTRLLRMQLRDPLVGRDVLVGVLCGVLLVLLMQLDLLLPSWLGGPAPTPKLPGMFHDLDAVLGLRYKLSIVVAAIMTSITVGLILMLLMLVVRRAIRPAWLAALGSWLLIAVLHLATSGSDVSFPWVLAAIFSAVAMLLYTQVGLVAMLASLFVSSLLVNSPVTTQFGAWYAPSGTFAVAFVLALLVWASVTARAGRPVFASLDRR